MATLATRCTACGTLFRVVPDQLRVSDGWVRCGRCAAVFNAAEALIDLDNEAPRPATEEQPAHEHPLAEDMPRPPPEGFKETWGGPVFPGEEPATPEMALGSTDFKLEVEPLTPPPQAPLSSIAAAEPAAAGMSSTDVDTAVAQAGTETPTPHEPAIEATANRAEIGDLPSFVRRANRAERWQQPRVRAALWAATVLGGLGLAGQVTYEYRDQLAARFAATRPALEQACAVLGCSVGAAHAIDSITVESSGLVRVEKSSIYKLSVALRNRAGIDVALPALDLTLTDSQGKLLARRVLRSAELGVNQTTLAAGRDLALQATLQAVFLPSNDPVAGYTIELFYP